MHTIPTYTCKGKETLKVGSRSCDYWKLKGLVPSLTWCLGGNACQTHDELCQACKSVTTGILRWGGFQEDEVGRRANLRMGNAKPEKSGEGGWRQIWGETRTAPVALPVQSGTCWEKSGDWRWADWLKPAQQPEVLRDVSQREGGQSASTGQKTACWLQDWEESCSASLHWSDINSFTGLFWENTHTISSAGRWP